MYGRSEIARYLKHRRSYTGIDVEMCVLEREKPSMVFDGVADGIRTRDPRYHKPML